MAPQRPNVGFSPWVNHLLFLRCGEPAIVVLYHLVHTSTPKIGNLVSNLAKSDLWWICIYYLYVCIYIYIFNLFIYILFVYIYIHTHTMVKWNSMKSSIHRALFWISIFGRPVSPIVGWLNRKTSCRPISGDVGTYNDSTERFARVGMILAGWWLGHPSEKWWTSSIGDDDTNPIFVGK